jgi:phosphodiester glycosidase
LSEEWTPAAGGDAWQERDTVARYVTQPAGVVTPLADQDTARVAVAASTTAPPATADPTGALVRWPSRKPRHRRDGRRLRRRIITVVVLLAVVLGSGPLINSPVGARGADLLRAALGPRATAQIESFYFGVTDALTRLRTQISHNHGAAPWAISHTATLPAGQTPGDGTGVHQNRAHLMVLPAVKTIIAPALPDEGIWISSGLPAPGNRGWPVPMAKTYIRPDPDRPYAVVMVVAVDLRQAQLHMVDGTAEPAYGGPGVIPVTDQSSALLLAAFNGGFKAADGHYGLMVNGHTYLPPQPHAATLALYGDNSVRIGEWGTAAIPTDGITAFRQNGAPLIVEGEINPTAASDGWAWGAPILANIYTWRSALALTANGVLLYAAGNAVTASTLARALVAAGAEQAMELDINPVWVRCMTYQATRSTLTARKLRDDMYGYPNQFLVPYERDFIYLTRLAPVGWPTFDVPTAHPQ